jgi:hypothetical protein
MTPFTLEEEPPRRLRRVWLHEGRFHAQIEFDEDLAAALGNMPLRKYDVARTRWVVPPTPEAAAALLAIVEAHGFEGAPEDVAELKRIGGLARQIEQDARLRAVGRYIYRAPDFGTLISIPNHPLVAEEVKDLLGAVWDKRVHAFRVEATARSADAILAVAGEYDFFVEPAEYERLVSMGETLFEDDEFTYDPLASADRILYRMLLRLPKSRRESLFDAVRNYRYL